MDRFEARQWAAKDEVPHMEGTWCVFDTEDNDEPLFGDAMPRDQKEAEQCARAANLAAEIVHDEVVAKVRAAADNL